MESKDFQKTFPNLPYKFKHNPDEQELKKWIKKQRRLNKIMMWLSPFFIIGSCWQIVSSQFQNYDSMLMIGVFIFTFFFFKNRLKQLTLSDEEIAEYVKSVQGGNEK